jgi:hypothetical protein
VERTGRFGPLVTRVAPSSTPFLINPLILLHWVRETTGPNTSGPYAFTALRQRAAKLRARPSSDVRLGQRTRMPEPLTKSTTVRDTSTSPGWASPETGMDSGAFLQVGGPEPGEAYGGIVTGWDVVTLPADLLDQALVHADSPIRMLKRASRSLGLGVTVDPHGMPKLDGRRITIKIQTGSRSERVCSKFPCLGGWAEVNLNHGPHAFSQGKR